MMSPPWLARHGVSRYEVWRLRPAAQDADAFMSLAVIADTSGTGDALGQVDELIGEWRTGLESCA